MRSEPPLPKRGLPKRGRGWRALGLHRHAWRLLAALASAAALVGCISGAASSHASGQRTVTGRSSSPPAGTRPLSASPTQAGLSPTAPKRPNIVFVLTDDLSRDLIRYMPAVRALKQHGMTLTNYYVSDSLCCPSRASIFTGRFPHDTGVFTNSGSDGGIGAFYAHDDENHTFNGVLQKAGYQTAMMGKYLNRYLQSGSPVPGTYVPPGWNEWDVAGWGYPEYDYPMNENGVVHHFGHSAQAYLTNVLARRGVSFINRVAKAHDPFFLELATFAPHHPYTPAPRDIHDFPGLKAPRPPNFDKLPTDAPHWLADHPPLDASEQARINRAFRRRAQSLQAVNRMLERIEKAVAAHKLSRDTYIVFSSDNGYHTGEYRLMPGKLTAFDTDIHVPLVVAGPHVPAGHTSDAMSENIDLAETFAAIGHTSLAGDGHSLLSVWHGQKPNGWRNAVLVEHHGPDLSSTDPDAQTTLSGNPTTYEAMRTPHFLYVEYRDGEREYYNLRSDPFELHNLAGRLTFAQLAGLHNQLARLENCHGSQQCWTAGHVGPGPNVSYTGGVGLTGALQASG
jgi:arylsulfatase A-like enzyme